MKSIYPALLISFLTSSMVHAQNYDQFVGTLRAGFRQISYSGKLQGCEINFETSAQDFAYRAGRPIIAGGSIALYIEPFGMMLKPGVADVLNNNIVEAPYYAFIKTSNGTTAGRYMSPMTQIKAIAYLFLKLIR